MTGSGRAIGLFGGTFDPVHNGHLRVALDALEGLGLAEVRLLPARRNPLRDAPGATAEQRRDLLAAAAAGEPGLRVDARELDRPGPSYTFDTLASLREEHGPDRALAWLVGGDAFRGLPGWHRWREFVDLAHLVVLQRPGYVDELAPDLAEFVAARRTDDVDALHARPAGRVFTWRVTQLEISSTDIRERVAAGRSIRYLVPDRVDEAIRRLGLYRATEAEPATT
ncbi:MAG: nicotinate-nucleotide adenylyltransferase [Gammaproteobacteria bacterium]|nr:nicotinate-nucleotide adenylyltransferase [Gammaproteobacteria bacterium]